jgi:hypothetical protein
MQQMEPFSIGGFRVSHCDIFGSSKVTSLERKIRALVNSYDGRRMVNLTMLAWT